jgi:formate dehydrogenase subunit gamma
VTSELTGLPVAERVRAIVAAHRKQRGALMPILHAVQAEFGYVDPAVEWSSPTR